MKITHKSLAISISFLIAIPVLALSTNSDFSRWRKLGYRLKENTRLDNNYKKTLCYDIYKAKIKSKIGIYCESSSSYFLNDMGVIVTYDPDHSNASDKIQAAQINTAMSSYSATAEFIGDRKFFGAEVDCDNTNGVIYRATATCMVYVGFRNSDKFTYTSFTLRNELTGVDLADTQDAQIFLKSLR